MTQVRITKSFRTVENGDACRYLPGDVARTNETGEWAVKNGFGENVAPEAKAAKKPKNKVKSKPKNKAKTASENKAR